MEMMEKGDSNWIRMAWWEPDVVPAVSGPLGSGKFSKSSKNGAPVEGEYRDTIEPEGFFSQPATLVWSENILLHPVSIGDTNM